MKTRYPRLAAAALALTLVLPFPAPAYAAEASPRPALEVPTDVTDAASLQSWLAEISTLIRDTAAQAGVSDPHVALLLTEEETLPPDRLPSSSRSVLNLLDGEVVFDREAVSVSEEAPATLEQQQALRKAQQYLGMMFFSYSGLIKQLEYEGYSHESSVYAVDHCDADWFEQAAGKAAQYLDMMSFSRSSLITQLEYEGFTAEQAEYAVGQVGY